MHKFCSTMYSMRLLCSSMYFLVLVKSGEFLLFGTTPTKGEVWPKPEQETRSDLYFIVKPQEFAINVSPPGCALVDNAATRYLSIVQASTSTSQTTVDYEQDPKFQGYLTNITVTFTDACPDPAIPSESMNEAYGITLTNVGSNVVATSAWGSLRGLETFSQLLFPANTGQLKMFGTTIVDKPRFPHRGLLLDTSRNFISVAKILKILDGMSFNKLNVFHWHITDDPTFPYESQTYPKLSEKGVLIPFFTYSPVEVQQIISYGAARGIRVVVEFDTPAHTLSWGWGIPQLLTPCLNPITPGLFNPTKDFTYSFLANFFTEVSAVFPDRRLHLGGDEVQLTCWEYNPQIRQFMTDNGIADGKGLENYYFGKFTTIVESLGYQTMVWEEVFNNGVSMPLSTIIQVWRGAAVGVDWKETIRKITAAGYPAVLSTCWYIDSIPLPTTWKDFYQCDPHDFGGPVENQPLILGGEACMWTTLTTELTVEPRIWPKSCATAEKLWSVLNADTVDNAESRIEEQACRMKKRGIFVSPPNGISSCP